MNYDLKNLITLADRYDRENRHDESDKFDKIMQRIAQYQQEGDNSNSLTYNDAQQWQINMSPYYARTQRNQALYQPNTLGTNQQLLNSVSSYGAHIQSGLSNAPYMQYFLISAERLFTNTINAGYQPQQAYQYALSSLWQSMQNKRVPQKVAQNILSAFNDWMRFTKTDVNTGQYPQQSYYAQQYPQRSHITTRRQNITPRGQFGRTRFFG